MRSSIKIGTLVFIKTIAFTCIVFPAWAQVSPQENTTTVSRPGKVSKTETVRTSVVVIGIDKAKRNLTLKNSLGQSFDVTAGEEVRNFNQIAVGDSVNIEYKKSLTIELTKADLNTEPGAAAAMARAQPGEKPAATIAGSVTTIAEVIDVNPEAKTITLRGGNGHIVVLDVKNPEHFRVVKEGDHVQATYSEAVAISVEPVAKPAKKSS